MSEKTESPEVRTEVNSKHPSSLSLLQELIDNAENYDAIKAILEKASDYLKGRELASVDISIIDESEVRMNCAFSPEVKKEDMEVVVAKPHVLMAHVAINSVSRMLAEVNSSKIPTPLDND